jgi:hypothetical protein
MPDPIPADLDLGHVREGVVEIDPMSGRMVIRSETPDGFAFFDVQDALEKYDGQEIRVIIVPISTINRVADLVEGGSLSPSAIPSAGHG